MWIKDITYTNKVDFYTQYLKIVSAFQKKDFSLADREIEVLAIILSLNINKNNLFNTASRKIVLKELDTTSQVLTNTIKGLLIKKAVYKNEYDLLDVHKSLKLDTESIDLKITLNYKNEETE